MLAIVLQDPTAALAQAGNNKKLEAIRQRMEQGLALFVAGDAVQAAREFEAGYAEYPYSAFLFNAGVCYQKQNETGKALEKYREYLKADPLAPDIAKVQERITALEAQLAPIPPVVPTEPAPVDPAAPPEQVPPEPPPSTPPPALPADNASVMRSLIVVETEPAGAPMLIFERATPTAPAFKLGGENPGWKQVVTQVAPASLSLPVGEYHIVVDKFLDFNASETDLKVMPGHVHHFKANLSQGVFMSFLRVSANVRGAHIYLDDKAKQRPEWGSTPYGELVPAGEHEVLVEVPGFQPILSKIQLGHGEQKELEVRLTRVNHGFIRIDADAPEVVARLDGKPAGRWRSGEPPLDIRAEHGKHRLVLLAEGRKDFDGIVEVPKGQVLPIHAKMIPTYPRGAAWTQAIIASALIGTSVYFGVESQNLKDELEKDRKAGVLEASDSRITRGRWYAIGADAGFGVGGLFAVLATYNFIKDPLPESSLKQDALVEFNDPLKALPTAALSPGLLRRAPSPSRRATAQVKAPPGLADNWRLGATGSEQGVSFTLGGRF